MILLVALMSLIVLPLVALGWYLSATNKDWAERFKR
jgi:hypothetical protein